MNGLIRNAADLPEDERGKSMHNLLQEITDFLEFLHGHAINYALSGAVKGSIMVCIALPGERWEVNYYADGEVSVEIFKSSGHMDSKEKLNELFTAKWQ